MTGFIIEQAVISWIVHNGLNVGQLKNQQMTVTVFEGDRPNWQNDITKKPVFYYPRAFNFRAIDGIIVWIGSKPKTEKRKQKTG